MPRKQTVRDAASVLFLDSGGGTLAWMARGFATEHSGDGVRCTAASLSPSPVSPFAAEALKGRGIDGDGIEIEPLHGIQGGRFDLVVTMDLQAREMCPLFPGTPAEIHWNIEPPAGKPSSRAQKEFDRCAGEIGMKVRSMFENNFFQSMLAQRRNFQNILSSLPAGVIVHDLKRRIVYLSSRAESILGYDKSEVIGKDCHTVITPKLCGEECSIGEGGETCPFVEKRRYMTSYLTRDGQRRELEMSVVLLIDESGQTTGVLVSINDQTELRRLERQVEQTYHFSGIIGQDHKMQLIYDLITDLAQSDFPVVITGESGTGKELVARALHNESGRRDRLFVPINCGALPEGTLESELFGHVRGAFTGAIRDKKGRFELADGGTIFLDEVAELSPAMQVKLLRVLQEGTFEPVGSEASRTSNVRVISATNKDLMDLVKKGQFREDLYYRLAVVPIDMPPLRERRNDIPLLVRHFLRETSEKLDRRDVELSDNAMSVMMSYAWPGNVRQLQNAIQFALIKCRTSPVLPEHLPPELHGSVFMAGDDAKAGEAGRVGRRPKLTVQSVEFALRKTAGNKAKAARVLGVGRATLYNFLDGHPELAGVGED